MFSKSDDKAKSNAPGALGQSTRSGSGGGGTPSIISPDLKVVGNLASAGDLQIDGQIDGDIKSRSVTVGEGAFVKGSIVADTVRICGRINGKVKAASVTIASTAKVKGDIAHQTLSIEAGAELEGQVLRLESEKAGAASQTSGPRPVEASAAAKTPPATGSGSNGEAGSKPAAGG